MASTVTGGPGVNLVGYFRAQTGMGQSARLMVSILRAAGIPYRLIEEQPAGPLLPTDVLRELRHSGDPDEGLDGPLYGTNVIVINANAMSGFVYRSGRSLMRDRRSVGRWAWEVDPMPPDLARQSDHLDGIWVHSEYEREVLGSSGVTAPVRVLAPAVSAPENPGWTRKDIGLPDCRMFLYCFDASSVVDRKNPVGLIRAYLDAFPRPGDTCLVLKSQNLGRNARAMEGVLRAAGSRPDILIRDQVVDPQHQAALMAACDVYISLHRSEGFGLTMAEAMALGKPTIATGYSGNLDFMTDDNSFLVPYRLTEVPEGCQPYPPGAKWAEPDHDAAVEAMREVTSNWDSAQARGRRAADDMRTQHGAEIRAARLSDLLAELNESSGRRRPTVRRGGWGSPGAGRSMAHTARRVPLVARSETVVRKVLRKVVGWQEIVRSVGQVQSRINGLEAELRARPFATQPLRVVDPAGRLTIGFRREPTAHSDNGAYRGFEEVFRGPESFIRRRQEPYMELLRGRDPVVDLGCGRGELLDMLAKSGIGALGVESDPGMARRAREKGHTVIETDVIEWLGDQPESDIGAIVSMQVVEHLVDDGLDQMLRLSLRALRPGGLFIAETVNPHSLPALKTFWVDPTHHRPLFPETLSVLCVQAGFEEAYVLFPLGGGDLEKDLRSQGEYAVVATKETWE